MNTNHSSSSNYESLFKSNVLWKFLHIIQLELSLLLYISLCCWVIYHSLNLDKVCLIFVALDTITALLSKRVIMRCSDGCRIRIFCDLFTKQKRHICHNRGKYSLIFFTVCTKFAVNTRKNAVN